MCVGGDTDGGDSVTIHEIQYVHMSRGVIQLSRILEAFRQLLVSTRGDVVVLSCMAVVV